jgi:formylglycine-generating enzyme required for sulfatase activity
MGFGKKIKEQHQQTFAGKLRHPGRLALAAGLCSGLGVLALGLSVWNWLTPIAPVVQPTATAFGHEVFKGFTIQESRLSSLNQYTVVVGTPRSLVQLSEPVPGGSEIPVTWHWVEQPNPLKFGKSELWRAGTLPQVIRGCEQDWPRRSLVVIAADPADKAARKLAIQLLDRGSADAVLLGQDWEDHYRKELIQVGASFTRQEQLLVVVPSGLPLPDQPADFQGRYTAVSAKNLEALAKALDFNGVKPLPDVWQKQVEKVLNGQQGGVLLRGGPAEEADPASGVRFVQVCRGTFTMGSDKADASAYGDEKPAHQVTLSPFEISKYETTNAQYRRFRKDYQLNDDRPVVNVTWDDAKTFCEHYGYSLPTEAQWEYAARAGTTTRWSFGDDENQLGHYAWFSGNSKAVQPVGHKLPNPLGLDDMHGNALEWVADCYDEKTYEKRGELTVDPLESSCGSRWPWELRGGAYRDEPRDLRSARRIRSGPVIWDDAVGFRCVRGPHRQP